MITPLEARILDRNSECLGVSVETLMENAGKELAQAVDAFGMGRILFVCGSGNNGGDGYAASRYLTVDADYTAFRTPKSPLCRKMAEGVETVPYSHELLLEYDTVVDCVLGTGVEGTLNEEYSGYIDSLNAACRNVIACDIPTGLGTGKNVLANVTVTFHDAKTVSLDSACGMVLISDIGIPKEASIYVNRGDFLRYPIPKADSHKGQNGRLVIVGGGAFVGAPALAAMGALGVGADLVTILTPRDTFVPIASFSPSYIVKPLGNGILRPSDAERILEECGKADALLIGPGLGRDPDTADAVRQIIDKIDIPTVIDADAIVAVAGAVPDKEIVFTPHRRELSVLLGRDDPSEDDVRGSCTRGVTVLCKGKEDVIISKNEIRRNRTGCPGMTVGGTGDVLSGTVAGLVAKGMSGFDAACLGAHICGRAGEMAFNERSYGMTASDVADRICIALKEGLDD
ncbi:MAG: NAD(P)H-hydrate dehydratase [Candidatus Methanomethylophilaceae archaeon]